MKRLLLIFPVLSYLILAAHELRTGNYFFMSAWILLVVLILFLRGPWVRHLCIISLMLGLLIWTRVTVNLLQFRLVLNETYTLFLIIMCGVAALMIFSLYLLFKHFPTQTR